MAEKYSVSDVVNSIKLEYPIFKDIEVSDKRNEGMSDNRQLEYYSKEDSPTGKERVEIFNPNLQGEELKNAIFGDMLHSAPSKSKKYADKKLQLINSRTPEQIEIDNRAYEIAIKQGEKRPFDKWYAVSRSDAFIRGYLAKQWEDSYYTEEQKELMDSMLQTLKNKSEMAKGGAMLNQQTEMAFMQEGGLKDEGGTVDPVSGNDVPSGSMQEEVRDDVPAMLSEGEFVFPADVVRYIGLSKLMQMRQQAKMGLKIMEEMGQMGNSEEATLPDDFGIPDIEIIDDDEDEAPEMAQGGVIHAQQGTDVQNAMYRRSENRPSVGAVLMPDGTIDNSAMMDLYNRRQPQQTDFERMMGYGAGQGSNPYGPRRVPYKKEDGTIVNVLEDYMGRPMQDIEGLTRVNPYQAGPIFGGDTPAGGGIVSPVMPPMPVDPTDDTAARRDRDAFYGKGADSTGRLTSMAEARKQGKKLGDFSDAYDAQQARLKSKTGKGFLADLQAAREDLAGRPERFKTDFKNLIESLPDDLKNTTKNIVDAITNKKSSNKKSSRTLSASERRAAKKSKELKKTDYKDKKSIDAKKAETTKKAKKAGFSADDKYGALKKGGLMKRNYP